MNLQRYFLTDAAAQHGVPKPDYLLDAEAFLDAATKYRTEVEALEPPTLAGITPKTIGKTIDAILAGAQHGERLTLASQVENIADSDLETAYARFTQVLMVDLAKPFDAAAQVFMSVYDGPAPNVQDPAIVVTLGELVRLRDQMHPGRVGDSTPRHSAADLPTRCATLPCIDVLAVKVGARTFGTQRGSLEWLNGMLSVPGVRLKWLTPLEQTAHVAGLPVSSPAMV
jgi:hypothetical protein